jgi:hypothetical protein
MTECNDELFELLPLYINGSLSSEEKSKVEEHLRNCPKCQKEIEEIRWLSSGVKEQEEVYASVHIEPEKLVIFAEEPKSLNPDEITFIEKHLSSCSECYEELQTLKRANLELEALERIKITKPAKEVSVWEKTTAGLIWLVRKPALAYFIILLLAYPAARWLFRPSQSGTPPIPLVSSEKVYVLSEQTRETTEPASVFRDSKDKSIRLSIPFWADLDNQSYELVINTEKNQTIFDYKNFTDFGNQGFFQLVLNTDSIPDGRYVIIVKEKNRKDPTIFSETRFPFQIVRAKD